ncbi:hypothetical protein RMCBS344292_07253 [Rhizopus microsporus]|nr:hypothetical protein RMCBS344292_07253 [Rhizopus microsporus]
MAIEPKKIPDDLVLFKLPRSHKPGEDRASKLIARHQSTVDMITASLLGVNEGTYASTNTAFTDSTECNVLYIPQSSAIQPLSPVIIEFQHSVTKSFMCRSVHIVLMSDNDNSETSKYQETEGSSDPTPNLVNPYEEEDKIPSDLSIDHHPHRTCEYNFTFGNSDEKEEEENADEFENTSDESEWMVDSTCISDLCSALKNVTLELAKRRDPAQLSDIRLLVLNNIYKLDRDFASSVSKYFSSKVHTLLKPILSFDVYLPTKGLNCYDWCVKIEVSPP